MRSTLIPLLLAACSTLIATSTSVRKAPKRSVVRGKNTVVVSPTGEPTQAAQAAQMEEMIQDPEVMQGVQEMMQDPVTMQKMAQNDQFVSSMQHMLVENPDSLKELFGGSDEDEIEALVSDGHVATMDELHEGFKQLAKADSQYTARLKENLQVRNSLQRQLSPVMSLISHDNNRIKQHLAKIARGVVQAPTDDYDHSSSLVEEQQTVETISEIRAEVVRFAAELAKKIQILHKKDDAELAALWKDAGIHQKLKHQLEGQIHAQQAELNDASDDELGALDEVNNDRSAPGSDEGGER